MSKKFSFKFSVGKRKKKKQDSELFIETTKRHENRSDEWCMAEVMLRLDDMQQVNPFAEACNRMHPIN
jgi:hypothetical protein